MQMTKGEGPAPGGRARRASPPAPHRPGFARSPARIRCRRSAAEGVSSRHRPAAALCLSGCDPHCGQEGKGVAGPETPRDPAERGRAGRGQREGETLGDRDWTTLRREKPGQTHGDGEGPREEGEGVVAEAAGARRGWGGGGEAKIQSPKLVYLRKSSYYIMTPFPLCLGIP